MSEVQQETIVQPTDAELFEAATSAEPASTERSATDEAAAAEGNQPRDEHGRFAAKEQAKQAEAAPTQQQAEPKPAETQSQEQPDAPIPSWRAREMREERDAAKRRADDLERNFITLQNQNRQLMARFQETQKPKETPDLFVDPDAYMRGQVEPIRQQVGQEIGQLKEGFSQLMAVEKYGEEAVNAAFAEMEKQVRMHGPSHPDYVNITRSMHPFGELVKWHKQHIARQTVGDDPKAWFEKQLEEQLKDPAAQAKLLERIRSQAQPNGGARSSSPVVQLPPSLSRVPSAASAVDGDNDMSDGGLYRHATGR